MGLIFVLWPLCLELTTATLQAIRLAKDFMDRVEPSLEFDWMGPATNASSLLSTTSTTTTSPSSASTVAEDGGLCRLCLDKKADHVVLPCGHLCMCEGCVEWDRDDINLCPVCDGEVANTIRVVFP